MNEKDQEFGSDEQLEKHAREYHGLSLAQFKLMCEEAHKRYEGQFSSSVDKALAVDSFYEGFKVAIKEALEQPAQEYVILDGIKYKNTNTHPTPQPAQKPVAVCETILTAPKKIYLLVGDDYENNESFPQNRTDICWSDAKDFSNDVPYIRADLATHPHQWQGLTNDEIKALEDKYERFEYDYNIKSGNTFARAIEAKLKEKNEN